MCVHLCLYQVWCTSHLIYGEPDKITSVFFRCPFLSVLESISSVVNSVPPNKSIYLSCLHFYIFVDTFTSN